MTETTTVTRPSRAVVTNYGDNSVSVLNLTSLSSIGVVFVGTQPTALAINADETKAYVANYGSGSVSEINLITLTQSRVANVGLRPAALAMDPDGTAIWVGGEGYIKKISLATFSAVTSIAVTGSVTSLSISQAQGTILYNVVTNTTSGSGQAPGPSEQSTFSVRHMRISDQTILGSYAYSSAQAYSSAPGGSIPAPLVLANGSLVSADYGNSVAVSATPTGFVITDLFNNVELMSGTTPSPIRSIAVNPGQGVVYLTAPASNALITVPLPKAQ